MLLAVKIRKGAKILREYALHEVETDTGLTLKELLVQILNGANDCGDGFFHPYETGWTFSCMVSQSESAKGIHVPVSSSIRNASEFGKYLSFNVEIPNAPKQSRDAFSILMGAANAPVYPTRRDVIRNNKDKLFNDIVSLFESERFSYTMDTIKSGSAFCDLLTDILWMIDPHSESRHFRLPPLLEKFSTYNNPKAHNHKVKMLVASDVESSMKKLCMYMEKPWMSKSSMDGLRNACQSLINSLVKLLNTLKRDAARRALARSADSQSEDMHRITLIRKTDTVSGRWEADCQRVVESVEAGGLYKAINVDDLLPDDRLERHKFLEYVKTNGLCSECMWYTRSFGSNIRSLHFVWCCDSDSDNHDQRNANTVKGIDSQLPKYYDASVKKEFVRKASLLSIGPQKARALYKLATDDCTAAVNEHTKLVNDRIMRYIETEDEEIVLDLRKLNSRPRVFDQFFDKAAEFIETQVEQAVDDRRHSQVTHLAMAMSGNDLYEKIKESIPDVQAPSLTYFRMQWWPKNKSYASSRQYTGKLRVKHMIQSRQLHSEHCDSHFASAIYRYLKSFCVKYKDHVQFLCVDDKCKLSLGDPGFPLSSVARGKRVVVGLNQSLVVGDHDFSRCSLTPSVTFRVDVPETVDGSWYKGQVAVALKDSVFQPSCPNRHAAEMIEYLGSAVPATPEILCIYSDGGPDHRCTYLSVMYSMIYVWCELDLDMLVLCRTPPGGSWKNPAERIMSQLNIALQSVGLMRDSAGEFESDVSRCNTMKDIRAMSQNKPGLQEAFENGLTEVISLVNLLFSRLTLDGVPFKVGTAAEPASVDCIIPALQTLFDDESISSKNTAAKIPESMMSFMRTHCQRRHYTFSVKKCDSQACQVCKPVRLSADVFLSLHHLPDPIPDETKEHYRSFNELYGKVTTEQYRPSLKRVKAPKAPISHDNQEEQEVLVVESESDSESSSFCSVTRKRFLKTAQTARNIKRYLRCGECLKPRVVYAERKLTERQIAQFDSAVEQIDFVCGSHLSSAVDAGIKTHIFLQVYMNDLSCADKVEASYYSSQLWIPVCRKCGGEPETVEGANSKCGQC